jgi:hypothetical protein
MPIIVVEEPAYALVYSEMFAEAFIRKGEVKRAISADS